MLQPYRFREASMSQLILIDPLIVPDDRGYLSKPFEKAVFSEHGIEFAPWEELRSYSHKGVLRGLHFQRVHSQDKLIQVLRGAVCDVAVDLRGGSPTFGKWESFELTEENRQMLYIPKGFAHGFLALREGTLFSYLCGDRYDPESDGGIRWNDTDIGVRWPLEMVDRVVVSDKDASLPSFAEFKAKYGALSGGATL